MIDRRLFLGGIALATTSCATNSGNSTDTASLPAGFQPWSDQASPYVIFPGDELDLVLPSATELNRTLTVAPDGRLSLPMSGHIMAAERTLPQLEADISQSYASQILRPAVELTLRRAAPAKIWIDGQVRTPGAFDLPGENINAYQALLLAGGATLGARARKVVLIRRDSSGQPMMTVLDLRARSLNAPQVYRGDILFVPRNTLGEIASFFSQVREAMPIGFSYALNGWN